MKKIKVGDRVRIMKNGTSTLLPPETGYSQKLLLEDTGRIGTVTGLSKTDKKVVRVKWDPGSYRIFDDFVLGSSGHLEVRHKGRVDIGSIESNIHSDFIKVVSTLSSSVPLTQESRPSSLLAEQPSGAREIPHGTFFSMVWRKVFGLSLAEKKQCYREMREFVDASMPVTIGIRATSEAAFRAADKWGISLRRANAIFNEGIRQEWTIDKAGKAIVAKHESAPKPTPEMDIEWKCDGCGQDLITDSKYAGAKVECRKCKKPLTIPQTSVQDTKSQTTAKVPSETSMILFFFNSDGLPSKANTGYGAFSETRLLTHLFASWNQITGQDIAKTEMEACHGDLFECHPLGDSYCTVRKLRKMMRDDDLDGSRLDPAFDSAVRKGGSVGFIPWVIGLCPVPEAVVQSIHDALKAELPEFYLGVIKLPPSYQFESTASSLSLPQDLRILRGQLVGDWQGKAR